MNENLQSVVTGSSETDQSAEKRLIMAEQRINALIAEQNRTKEAQTLMLDQLIQVLDLLNTTLREGRSVGEGVAFAKFNVDRLVQATGSAANIFRSQRRQ